MNKMFRGGLVLGSAVVIGLLSGCASSPKPDLLQHNFTEVLSQPRPRSADKSYALKKIHSEFSNYSPRVLGCLIDTAVWEDELPAYKGGFDPLEVYDATIGWNYSDDTQKAEEFSKVLNKYGTMPWVTRWGLEYNGDDGDAILHFLNNNYTYSDMKYLTSLENKSASGWTTEGAIFSGVLLATSMISDSLAWIRERNQVKEFSSYIMLSYRLTPEDEKELEKLGLEPDPKSAKQSGDLGEFYAEKILRSLGKATEASGYTVVSDIVKSQKDKTKAKMHLAVDGKGCPKADPKAPWKECDLNVGFARNGDDSAFSVRLGQNGSKTASIIFDANYDVNMYLPNEAKDGFTNFPKDVVSQLLALHPNITLYVPAYKSDNVWYPQYVWDSKGKHYFVVPVKRDAKKL